MPPQNLVPPPIQHHNWTTGLVYNTLMNLPIIPTTGGNRQIQGWCPPFSGLTYNSFGVPSNMNGLAFNGNAISSSATLIGGGAIAHSSNAAPVQVDPFCHLDLANFLPADTIKTIRSRGYIDFAKLLPANMEDLITETNTQQVTSIGGLCLQATTKKPVKTVEIDGIIKWVRTFSVWSFVFLDTHPNEAKGLFQYMAAMINGDKCYCWNILYNYDKNIRFDLSKDPFKHIGPCNVIRCQDVTGYVKVHPGKIFGFLPNSPVCSPHRHQRQVMRREEVRSAKATCHKFNAGNCTCKKC